MLDNLKAIINTPAGQELREYLLEERDKMNKLPRTLNPFLFFGSMIEILASQKAIIKIDLILNKLGITKEVIKKDPRDQYE